MANNRRVACVGLAAGAFFAPGFVAPSPSAPRTVPSQTASLKSSTNVSNLAVAGVATSALAAVSVGKAMPKTSRKFFGGDSGSSYASFDPAKEMGVQDPIGFWDPLGLSADKDEATFKRRRAVEIKHGRIAMYATIGYIVPEYYKFPGYLSPSLGLKFADVPNGLAALSKLPVLGGAQIIAFAGLIETTGFFQASSTTDGRGPREGQFAMKDSTETAEPGNYGVGFPNFLGKVEDPEARKSKLAAELANGRLAMMAIIGMFFQDGLTGSAWGDWANYTGSPLRAFENELGVQEPVGFWDPAGFTADGDMAAFKRRRSVELKHGRISMMATMGYITPEITGKLPGALSPSAGLKFADIPNGLAAVSKVPVAGWAQIAAYFGFVEFSGGFDDYKTGTPGDYGFKVLTSADPAEKTKKLSAELANGRLAMMAIIGMFFQDGLTGSAWGDWANYTASPLRAEPVSAAAAAAAATKAAAAAKGATASASAVAGSAGAGSLTKGEGVAGKGKGGGSFDPSTQIGAMDPLGFFDPAGFAKAGDEAGFRNLRAAEIKHGRVAMMAALGAVVQHYVKFPGFDSVPSGLAASLTAPGSYGFVALFAVAGILELGAWTESDDKEPGNFGDPVGFNQYTQEMREREINNGRFAMFAAIGIIAAELYTGKDAIEQFGL